MSRRLTIILLLTFWLTYLVHFNPGGAGSGRFTFLAIALAEHGTIDVTPYHTIEPVDIMAYKGHYYINTNPGLAFLAAPFWAIAFAGYRHLPEQWVIRTPASHYFLAHFICCTFTTALFGALTPILLARFVFQRTGVLWKAVFVAFLYAFGTTSFYLATRLNQNVVITFLAFAIFILIFEPSAICVPRCRFHPALLLGLAIGIAIFIDLSILPFVAAVSPAMVRKLRDQHGTALFALAMLIPIGCLMLYQWTAFGQPFFPAQYYLPGFMGPAAPSVRDLVDHLILPTRGLFVYMPFALLSVWYMQQNWRTDLQPLLRQERNAIAVAVVVFLCYVSIVRSSVYSGFGPRYLLPILPFPCMILALYLRPSERNIAFWLVGLSFFIQLVGAQCGRDTHNLFFEIFIWLVRGPWLPVIDWLHLHTHIAGWLTTTIAPGVVNPSGMLLVLALILAMLWTPYCLFQARAQTTDGQG